MLRTCFVLSFCLFVAVPGFAAEERAADATPVSLTAVQTNNSKPAPRLVLPALYVSLAGLQAYDAFSTLTVLKRGGVEANPVMKGIVGSPLALVAVKAGTTAGSICVAERLWRQNRKGQAIALMVATNGLMAAVAAHNTSVMRGIK
jgi:hypothetical protein